MIKKKKDILTNIITIIVLITSVIGCYNIGYWGFKLLIRIF